MPPLCPRRRDFVVSRLWQRQANGDKATNGWKCTRGIWCSRGCLCGQKFVATTLLTCSPTPPPPTTLTATRHRVVGPTCCASSASARQRRVEGAEAPRSAVQMGPSPVFPLTPDTLQHSHLGFVRWGARGTTCLLEGALLPSPALPRPSVARHGFSRYQGLISACLSYSNIHRSSLVLWPRLCLSRVAVQALLLHTELPCPPLSCP